MAAGPENRRSFAAPVPPRRTLEAAPSRLQQWATGAGGEPGDQADGWEAQDQEAVAPAGFAPGVHVAGDAHRQHADERDAEEEKQEQDNGDHRSRRLISVSG